MRRRSRAAGAGAAGVTVLDSGSNCRPDPGRELESPGRAGAGSRRRCPLAGITDDAATRHSSRVTHQQTAYCVCQWMRMEKGICVSCVLTFWAVAYCELRI